LYKILICLSKYIKKAVKFLKLYLWQRWRIPKGDYCYKILRIDHNPKEGLSVIYTKVCPYWEIKKIKDYDEEDGYCTLLDLSDALIWDKCKSCGIRNYFWRELCILRR